MRNNPNVKKTQFKLGHIRTLDSIERQRKTLHENGSLLGSKNPMFGRNKEKNPNWQGGVSYWRKEYYNSIPYKEWQKTVFKRDNYKCQICNDAKGRGKILHAHHIKSFARFPVLRFDQNNGVTLCNKCHALVHSKGVLLGKVKEVRQSNETEEMIDIEVKDNNNFFANSILVHNSATPFREDGRVDLIFALTGYPVGLAWDEYFKMGLVQKPIAYCYIVQDFTAKMKLIKDSISKSQGRTIIYCDSIDLGKQISTDLNIPFVSGETSKNRLQLIENNRVSVVSRVGDEGLDITDLSQIIEVSFLYGSRRQELQRFGRLLHSRYKGQHMIIMTRAEYDAYKKRLLSLMEKGFQVVVTQV